jgi:hypothetical protein
LAPEIDELTSMAISLPLDSAVVSCLSKLSYRPDAAQQVCIIPLSGIYWEDEMPAMSELFRLAESSQLQIFRLFSIRYKLWDGETLSMEDQQFWDSARAQVPGAAIFQRITLSPADQSAHMKARQSCEQEFEQLFADADEVTLTDLGSGVQNFSARFDLAKSQPGSTPKQPWWKRVFSRRV